MRMPFGKNREVQMTDISRETFGKYQRCTSYEGVFYADSDFENGLGSGKPKRGAVPSTSEADRTPFGEKRKPVEPEAVKAERRATEQEQAHALLERLAEEASGDVAAAQDAREAEFRAAHIEDFNGYESRFRRLGDFLTLEIIRPANPERPKETWFGATYGVCDRLMVTTVNLGLVTEIRLHPGHGPDRLGEASFGFTIEHLSKDGKWSGTTFGSTGMGNYLPRSGSQFKVRADQPCAPHGRPLFVIDEKPEADRYANAINMNAYDYRIRHRHSEIARPAADDRIRLEGLGATLYAPAGRGAAVLAELLAAIEQGARA